MSVVVVFLEFFVSGKCLIAAMWLGAFLFLEVKRMELAENLGFDFLCMDCWWKTPTMVKMDCICC